DPVHRCVGRIRVERPGIGTRLALEPPSETVDRHAQRLPYRPMRLYDNPASSNALKVRFLLAELGLAYEREEVPIARPRPAAYVALNPFTGIPTLDDDGFVLTESNAILRYLAQREGRDDLYPSEPRAQARVNELLDRFAQTVRPAFFKHEAAALGFKFG